MSKTKKDRVRDIIYARREEFIQIAHDIHDHPELGFCEEYAAARLTQFLTEEGFSVQRGICGMPTAFVATSGHGPLHIAFCAEYDALPPECLFDRSKPPELQEVWLSPERQDAPLSHACGHNLIAAASVAAAVSLREIADEVGVRITIFGTPGEELYGLPEPPEGRLAPGKDVLLEGGAFADVHAVLMVHPFPTPFSVFIPTTVYPRFRGQFSKAGPGGQMLGLSELKRLEERLKQAILSSHQIPALYAARLETESSGAQADILWVSRSPADITPMCEAVCRCFEEAALASGVTVQMIEYTRGSQMQDDPMLRAAFRKNSKALGRIREQEEYIQKEIHEVFSSPKIPWIARLLARFFPRLISPPGLFMDRFPVEITFGTDLANVSHRIPAIHPMIGVGGTNGPHVAEFAGDIETGEAYRAMLDGGVALAWTALDAATDPAFKAHLLERASARKDPLS